jgi:hypothetical protein
MSTDQQLEILQNMNDVLSNKDSYYLTFTSNKSQFTQKFDVPIKLNQNRKYELALHNFTTTNYQINIGEENNKFYYTWNKHPSDPKSVIEQHEITFEKGAYEVKDIANEIIRGMKEKKHYTDENPPFVLSLKLSTFKSVIEIKRDELRIDFTKPNTVREMLGFESKLLLKGYNVSDNTVQITSSSSILIKCSIISGSYHNGKQSNVLYSLPAYVVPIGYKINIEIPERMYLPVNVLTIEKITFEIVDDNEKLLDFKNEKLALAIHLRQV